MNILHSKKFRYGSLSLSLTIVLIAAVILFNAIIGALARRYGWYSDMTPQRLYTLSDEAKTYLDTMDTDKEVEIIFCTPADTMEATAGARDVLETARDIERRYPNVKRRHVDILTNPTAVAAYKAKSRENITSQSVIVASGTECRVYTLGALFSYGSSSEIVGYNGEQRLVSAILAVTQDEKPLACVTTGHGEAEGLLQNTGLLATMEEMGFDVQNIDLKHEEIPEKCRLIVIFDPQTDFLSRSTVQDIAEIPKLDAFLQKSKSLMVFFDNETPKLQNLEDFLSKWGIAISRDGDAAYLIEDKAHSFTANGYTNVAEYVTTGLGGSMTEKLWKNISYPKSVVFPYVSAIATPDSYEKLHEDEEGAAENDYRYYYFKNGITRYAYDVFLSSGDATAMANGRAVTGADSPYVYMRVTTEPQDESAAYVLACASTDFASAAATEGGYGNHAVLSYAFAVMSREVVPVSLDTKYYTATEISSITSKAANQYTVVLAVIPAAVIFIAGIYVMVRRKYR